MGNYDKVEVGLFIFSFLKTDPIFCAVLSRNDDLSVSIDMYNHFIDNFKKNVRNLFKEF